MIEHVSLRKPLFDIDEVKAVCNSESNAFYLINKLIKKNIIKKLKSGLYATVNPITEGIFADKYEIGTAIYKDCAIGYHSALEYYGLTNQVYFEMQVIAKNNYSPIIINGLEYVFIKNSNDEGFMNIRKDGEIRVTNLERTIVDCIDRLELSGGIEEVISAISMITDCDETELLKHLKKYDKKVLYKKIGCIFSLLRPKYISDEFYKICKQNMSLREDDIRENIEAPYKYIKEWELYVPEFLIDEGV